MKKIISMAIPLITITIFILIMLSGSLLKMPLGEEHSLPQTIQSLIDIIYEEKWDEAEQRAQELNEIWQKIVNRVQFSSERDEINFFSSSLARLKGAIKVKDKINAIIELNEAYNHWAELAK